MWHKISDVEPNDHDWVLITHAHFGTPIKAKYHIGEGFSFMANEEVQFVYLHDNLIKYWTELPKMPEDYRE